MCYHGALSSPSSLGFNLPPPISRGTFDIVSHPQITFASALALPVVSIQWNLRMTFDTRAVLPLLFIYPCLAPLPPSTHNMCRIAQLVFPHTYHMPPDDNHLPPSHQVTMHCSPPSSSRHFPIFQYSSSHGFVYQPRCFCLLIGLYSSLI